MDHRVGGKIKFDDGEGSVYEAVITEFNPPNPFCFREIDDLLEISLLEDNKGCIMTFSHTFDGREMAIYTAAGWHRCWDVFARLIHGLTIKWEDNALELREYYKISFLKN